MGDINFVRRDGGGRPDICALNNNGAAIVGGRLYFGMSTYTFSRIGSQDNVQSEERSIYYIPLNSSFRVPTNISSTLYVDVDLTAFPDFPESNGQGVVLYTNTTLYFYAAADQLTNPVMFTYDVQTETGKTLPANGSGNYPVQGYRGGFASDPASGLMYYTGSQNPANGTATQPVLQILDGSDENTGARWLTGVSGGPDLLYTVIATGDIPSPRSAFCSAVSAAPDDSSFQITVYGGTSEEDSYHIYVLILPTFQWVDVTPDDRSLGDQDAGRIGFRCMPWNERQLIMLGGFIEPNANVSGWYSTNCTGPSLPLVVLDTSTYQWRDNFSPDQEYMQPRAVYELIGGDFRGGNIRKAPASGFNSSALNAIFAATLPRIEQPTTFAAANTSPSAAPTAPPPASKPSGKVIAGWAVPSFIALALIAGFIYYYIYNRRQSRLEEMPVLAKPESGSSFGGVFDGPVDPRLVGGIQTSIV
ncbi:hypothetical protein TWF694_008871 [Orbilia ellipsospora]|uniref:Uncharacterized protein n=1 Tax=Orbilia ellipsospora TaxID=2528407 RepID=A0AAV9XD64_9PEZI